MSFYDFSENQYVKTVDTSELVRMGGIKPASNIELAHIRVLLFIHDVTMLSGSEAIRLNVYSSTYYYSSTYMFSSSYKNISDITNLGANDWIGWVTVDFNRQNLNKNFYYYVEAEFSNYTRNGESFYFGLSRDFPVPIYDNSENLFYNHPLAMALFGYSEANQ